MFSVGITEQCGDLRGLQPRKICAKYPGLIYPLLSPVKGETMTIKKEAILVHHKHKKLFLCEKCLCWSGEVLSPARSIDPKPRRIEITCICNGLKCEICGNTGVKPISCLWRLRDDTYGHVPYFASGGTNTCGKCGGKMVK